MLVVRLTKILHFAKKSVYRLHHAVNKCDDQNALYAAMQHTKAVLTVIDAITLHPTQHILSTKETIYCPKCK